MAKSDLTLALCQCDSLVGCINCRGNPWKSGHAPYGMSLELALVREEDGEKTDYFEATPRVVERWCRIWVKELGEDPVGMASSVITEETVAAIIAEDNG